jgi:hypothetical protein
MSAAGRARTPLRPVPDLRDTSTALDAEQQRRARTVIDEYSAEHQFVGSLMWLSAQRARPLLTLVPDTAIQRPHTRWAYELIRGLVDAGTDPTPVSTLAAAHHQAARNAIAAATPPSADEHKRLALYLFDAYAQAIAPATAIDTYAREVLNQAYRCAFHTYGIRMQQLATCGADPDQLFEQFTTIADALADLRRRAQAAAESAPSPP